MHRFLALTLVLISCAKPASAPVEKTPAAPTCESTLDPGDVFSKDGLEGVFVLRDETTGCSRTTNAPMADAPFRPQSTFKIPNALIGLQVGVIEGEHHTWKWDGTPRRLKDWEQDLDLGGALKVSCVPCFQDVARRIGEERMRTFLGAFRYGNQDISGPIDAFWLDGPIRITPRGQTEFLHRMLAGELPVKKEHVELVSRLLQIEPGWHGKTGLGTMDGRAIGWLVGWTTGKTRTTYALFVRGGTDVEKEQARIMPLRKQIVRGLLGKVGVWP